MGTQGHEAEAWDEIAAAGEDIGHGVVIRYFGAGGEHQAGVLLYHRHADGAVCGGAVPFDVPANQPAKARGRAVWTVESLEPLTLSPSIQDPTCSEGLHGFIRAGRWEPA